MCYILACRSYTKSHVRMSTCKMTVFLLVYFKTLANSCVISCTFQRPASTCSQWFGFLFFLRIALKVLRALVCTKVSFRRVRHCKQFIFHLRRKAKPYFKCELLFVPWPSPSLSPWKTLPVRWQPQSSTPQSFLTCARCGTKGPKRFIIVTLPY